MSLTTPLSVQKLQTALHDKAKGSPNFRFYALYDKVYREDVMAFAYECCKANRGAAGVDGRNVRGHANPIFEADLPQEQYAYRADRSALDAVRHVHKLLNTGHGQIVDADLSGYFDSIPHSDLLKSVARRIVDGAMLHLIKMWLEAPVERRPTRKGISIGVRAIGMKERELHRELRSARCSATCTCVDSCWDGRSSGTRSVLLLTLLTTLMIW